MIAIQFDKGRAEHFIHCIKHGEAIQPPKAGAWPNADMLALAGALHAAAFSQGPAGGGEYREFILRHQEHREAVIEAFAADLRNATEFYSHLTIQVIDGRYDEWFEPRLSAILRSDAGGDGDGSITPVSGFKGD